MADIAHTKTDQKLEEMEKRLSAIYSRAEKEIQKTADEYFSRFAKQDEAKRKLLEQGKITEEEYTKWRKGKVMYGKRFTDVTGAEYTATAVGTVENVKSISPAMNLTTDKAGAVIDAECFLDPQAVITDLTNTVITLGGEI